MFALFETNPGMPPPGGCLTDPLYAHMSQPKNVHQILEPSKSGQVFTPTAGAGEWQVGGKV
jgi:hypothetical protein